jgi:predicted ATPase with chaperone activity
LLIASGQLPGEPLDGYALNGELGLDGTVRPVRIPLTGVTFFSHIEGAATGRLKMTLSTGDGA